MWLELINMFAQLWDAIKLATPEAVVGAIFVFMAVLVLRWLKVLPDSNWARAANVVFSILLSRVTSGAVTPEEVALLALTSAFAALLWDTLATVFQAKTGRKLFAV